MKKVRELVAKASQDFELAKTHARVREYATATVLYNKAVEKVLKALFINKTKREPPANASIEYLARRTGVPEEVSAYINSLDENTDTAQEEEFASLYSKELQSEKSAQRQALYMDGLAKRLIDYVSAYAKI
jgi:HEPN domain-containing protein